MAISSPNLSYLSLSLTAFEVSEGNDRYHVVIPFQASVLVDNILRRLEMACDSCLHSRDTT